ARTVNVKVHPDQVPVLDGAARGPAPPWVAVLAGAHIDLEQVLGPKRHGPAVDTARDLALQQTRLQLFPEEAHQTALDLPGLPVDQDLILSLHGGGPLKDFDRAVQPEPDAV